MSLTRCHLNQLIGEYSDSAELLDYCDFQPELRDAIIAAVEELNPRKIGWKLHSAEGRDLDGLTVEHLGEDSDGAIWQIRDRRSGPI